MPDGAVPAAKKFGRWLAALRVLLALAALADLGSTRASVPAACCALVACIPLERKGVPSHLLGLPAAALGAWSIHGTGMESASGLQLALFVLPAMVAFAGTLRREAPLY
jgi:hypothetical protein